MTRSSGRADGAESLRTVGRTSGRGGKPADSRADRGGKGADSGAEGRTGPTRRGHADGRKRRGRGPVRVNGQTGG